MKPRSRLMACIVLALAGVSAGPATTLPAQYDADIANLVKEFGDRLKRVRYMESGPGRDVTVPGWEGFPTRRYTYTVKDKDGTSKSADVVLLDPTPEQVATWIVQAIVEVKGAYDPALGRKAFANIIGQSGGQFPVAGVVYEDILPPDGKNEIYCFRDGVTVRVDGVPHRGTDPLTPERIEASMAGKVVRVFTYARIQSTTPDQFIAAGGVPDILTDGKPTEKWLAAVRKAYQDAWTSPRNALLVAWVRANAK